MAESARPVTSIGTDTVIPGGPGATASAMADCEQLFDRLPAPAADALHGVYRGRVAGVPGLGSTPGPLGRLVARIAPHLPFPWYGKAFYGPTGANVWLTSTGRFMRVDYEVSYHDDAARLSYDRPGNPGLVRDLKAEVRTAAPGRYLCRATRRGKVLLYFTLEA